MKKRTRIYLQNKTKSWFSKQMDKLSEIAKSQFGLYIAGMDPYRSNTKDTIGSVYIYKRIK